MNDWYEQWSKAGANPNFRVENAQEYIRYFNWVSNWFEEYFFTKVSDFLFGIFLLTLIFILLFRSKQKKPLFIFKGEKFIYFIILILFFEWFYNHPALRYGGYQLLCLLLFLPVSNILSSKKNLKNVLFKTNVLLLITLVIFVGRNINRLVNENTKYGFNPFINPTYRITDNHFLVHNKYREIIDNKFFCNHGENQCVNKNGIDVKEIYGYKIFYRQIK